MTANKTFLILLLTGISYTAYNAAAISENFEISTTIDHEIVLGNFKAASSDADLDVTDDINLGTIYVNPVFKENHAWFSYDELGKMNNVTGDFIVRADRAAAGRFTANIPNPEACTNRATSCGGLRTTQGIALFGGSASSNWCNFYIKYSGNDNVFTILPNCSLNNLAAITLGLHTATFTISYDPE
ncbi:MAG: hypothetical protein IJ689_03740 [Alphaproteobacteria bacterium]|nr:hypothetical protein [Alphaproteobacteria bacterium]